MTVPAHRSAEQRAGHDQWCCAHMPQWRPFVTPTGRLRRRARHCDRFVSWPCRPCALLGLAARTIRARSLAPGISAHAGVRRRRADRRATRWTWRLRRRAILTAAARLRAADEHQHGAARHRIDHRSARGELSASLCCSRSARRCSARRTAARLRSAVRAAAAGGCSCCRFARRRSRSSRRASWRWRSWASAA